MPNRDGTGPVGKGPLTGGRQGSCMLRIPDRHDEPVQGFAGKAGRFFSLGGEQLDKKEESVETSLGFCSCKGKARGKGSKK